MEDATKEYIEKFLDEFLKIEYKGRDHVLARAHYRDLFNQLIPKYFVIKEDGRQDLRNDEGEDK